MVLILSTLIGEVFMDEMELKLGMLQRKLREKRIPFLIIFEGPSAAGRGRLISKLIRNFDSRGYNLVTRSILSECEIQRLPMQKYWINIPEKGRIAIFERSPYGELLYKGVKKKELLSQIEYIKDFERTLAEDGTAVLKIFLDIDKKEQKKRLKKLKEDKNTSWRVGKDDWKQNKDFDQYTERMNYIISATEADYAPWFRIDSSDLKTAENEILAKVADFMHDVCDGNLAKKNFDLYRLQKFSRTNSVLDNLDLTLRLSREEYDGKIQSLQKELLRLEFKAYKKRLPVIIVFEGCDAAGKGGAIKRLTQGLDPRGFDVIPISAPDEREKKHNYLWRFWRHFPKKGHFAIFDRSWYGRVLVERVEKFCTEDEWLRAYDEINQMEKYLSDSGAVICKFWLQISSEEQLRRFKDRQEKDYKKWKITEEDWRNREKWPQYKDAIEDMLVRTNTSYAPWTVVEAESKLYSRVKIISEIVAKLKKKL